MLCLILFISLGFGYFVGCEELYTVSTQVGSITGKIEPMIDQHTAVTKFLGIPFAEPPVGDLRFRKPVKKGRFNNTGFSAIREGVACSQIENGYDENVTLAERSEDCLLLNIYVPYNMSREPGLKKPVMVWIYGGGFLVGESNTYDGSLLSVSGDVIVVTINYRLGILGFLTSGDSSLPGNLGLWDQQLAIQWVHEHIESFGGDQTLVTIFGSASVVYQCFYPGNGGLFQRAIAQSGSITSPFSGADQQVASQNLYFLADQFNCDKSTTDIILDCLRKIPVNSITNVLQTPVPLTPVYDGEFVLDTPKRIITGQSMVSNVYTVFNSIDLMIGYTNADGFVYLGIAMPLLNMSIGDDFLISKTDWEDTLIPLYLNFYLGKDYSQVARMFSINEYTDWRDPMSASFRGQQFVDFLTDSLFLVPTVETADLHSTQSSSTYVYEFAVRPIKHVKAVPPNLDRDDFMNHGDDTKFVFGGDIDRTLTEPAYSYLFNTYRETMALWTNFAKTGNPNTPEPVSGLINTTWPQYATEKKYLKITTNMSQESVKISPRPRAVNYWTNVITGLVDALIPNNTSRHKIRVRVTTALGDVIGVESYIPYSADCGYRVQSYLGIPFAQPPTGNLRFQKPRPKEPFTEPFDGSKPGPSCYQTAIPGLGGSPPASMSEDCLVLNVFVPKLGTVQVNNKPVMIWIHGGGFSMGESNAYDPKVLAGYSDVIVVTINYRVGQLGFLTTGDTVIPSNIGLWDQRLAIQWVHNNIRAFGGDNSRITILGDSAGSASVIFQTFYPGNRGLFQRAIAESGSNGSPWASSDIQRSIQNTRDFSGVTGCPLTTNRLFLECLQSMSIEDLHNALNMIPNPTTLPVRDNDFILDHPDRMLSGETQATAAIDMFHSVDLMIGFTSADGLYVASLFPLWLSQTDLKSLTLPRSGYEDIMVSRIFNYTGINDLSMQAKNLVIHEYTDWSDPELETKRAKQLVDLYTDYLIAIPSIRTADLHAASGTTKNTYLYKFSVRPFVRYLPVPDMFDGPGVMNHGGDILYVLGNFISNITDRDDYQYHLRISLVTMTMWANFAKSGDPNAPLDITKYLHTSWPEYTSSRQFLEITEEITQHPARQNPRLQALNFWTRIFPEAYKTSQFDGSCDTSSAITTNPFSASMQILIVCLGQVVTVKM